jgi:hypothetical protein
MVFATRSARSVARREQGRGSRHSRLLLLLLCACGGRLLVRAGLLAALEPGECACGGPAQACWCIGGVAALLAGGVRRGGAALQRGGGVHLRRRRRRQIADCWLLRLQPNGSAAAHLDEEACLRLQSPPTRREQAMLLRRGGRC